MMAWSPVFRDLVECCPQKPTLDESSHLGSGDSRPNVLEVPLDDPEDEIASLVEHVHRPERFWESVVPVVTKEGSDRILLLASTAFKYDMQGTLILHVSNLLIWVP
jgi:hypothetical protein